MYEKLSARVDRVVKLANEIAREYEQEYVGTEHVLLAIAREGTGLGARLLQDRGLDEYRLREAVDKLIQTSMEDTWVFGRLPGSPHFRNVIAKAIEEARALKSGEVGTEHLLLGILAEAGCVGQKALTGLGMTLKDVREQIRQASGA